MAVVRQSFKPEFLNRLDEVVMFDALTQDELAQIVDLQLALLEKRLAVRRITITVTDAAAPGWPTTGYDPAYGARPLRRLIQTAIGDPLARLLIGGEVVDGGAVTVDPAEDGGGLVLLPAAAADLPSDSAPLWSLRAAEIALSATVRARQTEEGSRGRRRGRSALGRRPGSARRRTASAARRTRSAPAAPPSPTRRPPGWCR